MHTGRKERKNLRRLMWAGASLLVICGLVVSYSVLGRYAVQGAIRANGFPQARVADLSLSPRGIFIDHIDLDGNDFSTVDGVDVRIGWGTPPALSVKSLSLMAEMDEQGHFRMAGWDATMPQDETTSGGLPFGSVHLEGVSLDLDTPQGDFRIDGKLHIAQDELDKHQTIAVSLWTKQNQLSFSIDGKGVLYPDGRRDLSFELMDGRVDFDAAHISRLSGWIKDKKDNAAAPSVVTAGFSAGSVKTLNALLQNVELGFDSTRAEPLSFRTSPAGHPDITIAGRWNKTPPEQFELMIESKKGDEILDLFSETPDQDARAWMAQLSPLTIQLALPVTIFEAEKKQAAWAILAGDGNLKLGGTAELDAAKKSLLLDLAPATMGAAQVGKILPLKERYALDLAGGTIGLSGKIDMDFGGGEGKSEGLSVKGPLSIEAKDISGDWNGFLLKSLGGKVGLTALSPWAIGAPAEFTAILDNEQEEVARGRWTIAGNGATGLAVSNAVFDLAGGSVTASPFVVKPQTGEISTDLAFEKVDLGALAALAHNEALTAQGVLSGKIPVKVKDGEISFAAGKIESTGDGYFKYAPGEFPASLQGDDPRMKTVREALSDFRFSVLSFDMDGPMNGKMTTKLKASGTSPLFGDRPIELNLNLEGDIGKALQQLLQAGDLGSTLRSAQGDKKK